MVCSRNDVLYKQSKGVRVVNAFFYLKFVMPFCKTYLSSNCSNLFGRFFNVIFFST